MFTPNAVRWKFAKYLLAIGCIYIVFKFVIKTNSNKSPNQPSVKSSQSKDEPDPHQNIEGKVNDSIKYYKSEMYDSAPFIWNNEFISHPNKSQDQDQGRLSGQRKKLIIIINSSRSNFRRRQLIRQTFGSINNLKNWIIIPPVFLVGQTNQMESPWIGKKIEIEHESFNDLIKKDFIDSYRNLTLKSIMGFEWVHKYCHDATIVIKMDDDVVLNIFQLIKILDENPEMSVSSNIYCYLKQPEMPNRVIGHPWYVSKESYPHKFYPRYCSGLGVVTTVKTIDLILDQVDQEKVENVLTVDNTYLTGIIPHKINEKLRSLNSSTGKIEGIGRNIEWYHTTASESIPNYLRDWYQNPEMFGLNHKIFYLVPQFENYIHDFAGTWKKIKLTEGQI